MPKGASGVAVLQLETLNKLISKLPANPNLYFANMFGSTNYPSDAIKWEIEYGSAGLTPFVAPGAVAPAIGLDGIGEGSAKAAFYKEKMYFDEEFLNNIRLPGTDREYQSAERHLSRGLRKLRNRMDRRTEWMMAKAIIEGGFTYTATGNTKFTVSYGIPSTHIVTLATDDKWNGGTTATPISDMATAKEVLADDAGVVPNKILCNSNMVKTLMLNSDIQALLEKSAFGNGDLFARPASVIGELMGVGPLEVYDAFSETEHTLVANVTGGATTDVYVDDATDIEVGATARLIDTSESNVWEDATITAVDKVNHYFTIAVTTLSFKAAEDKVIVKRKYIDDGVMLLFSTTNGNNEPIAEYMKAPFGLGRNWGMKVDRKEEWDPEGLWMRVQNKGLPVVYHPDCIYKIIAW